MQIRWQKSQMPLMTCRLVFVLSLLLCGCSEPTQNTVKVGSISDCRSSGSARSATLWRRAGCGDCGAVRSLAGSLLYEADDSFNLRVLRWQFGCDATTWISLVSILMRSCSIGDRQEALRLFEIAVGQPEFKRTSESHQKAVMDQLTRVRPNVAKLQEDCVLF